MDMGKEYEDLEIGQLFRWHCQGGECETDVDDIGVLTSKDYHNREINILWSSDGQSLAFNFDDFEESLLQRFLEKII
jgi:hypothetical protein